jgi:YVTN family beta-propeller protein
MTFGMRGHRNDVRRRNSSITVDVDCSSFSPETVVIATASHRIVGRVKLESPFCPDIAATPDGAQVWLTLKDIGKTMVFDAQPPFNVLKVLDTGPITNHVNIVRNGNGQFAYVTVGGLNVVKVFRTDSLEQVAEIPTGDLPHGLWPSGDGTRIYVGIENGDAAAAIDTRENKVIATVPLGQAPHESPMSRTACRRERAGRTFSRFSQSDKPCSLYSPARRVSHNARLPLRPGGHSGSAGGRNRSPPEAPSLHRSVEPASEWRKACSVRAPIVAASSRVAVLHRLRACATHRQPLAAPPATAGCPRAASMRREAVLEALGEEHRAPALAVVAPELEVVFLAGHTGHDVANAAPAHVARA